MSGDRGQLGAVGRVREAARHTLELQSVRLAYEAVSRRPPEATKLWRRGEGIADLAARRADVTVSPGPAASDLLSSAAHALIGKHPWALGEDELAEIDTGLKSGTSREVYAGGAVFKSHPHTGAWYHTDGDIDSPRRRPDDPLWILEVLCCADDASLLGTEDAQGDACERFGFHVDLALHAEEVDVRPRSLLGPAHVAGELWVDRKERVRRTTWQEIPRRRGRTGSRATSESEPPAEFRKSLELWDQGGDVSIEIPEVPPSHVSTLEVCATLATRLWRRKRQYERDRRGTET